MKIKNHSFIYILIGFILLGTLLLPRCTKAVQEGEPVTYNLFFIIKNRQTGNDFFLNNPTYKVDSLKELLNTGLKDKIRIDSSSSTQFKRIEWGTTSRKSFLIDYGNGDIDTIRHEWYPASNTFDFNRADWSKVYFNGALVKNFDFANDPSLKTEVPNRNNPEASVWSNNPIVIELRK